MRPIILVALWALLFPTGAFADHLRCGQYLIGAGDSEHAFFEHCSAPLSTSQFVDEFGEIVTRYLVQPSKTSLVMQVDIVRGKVREVERADGR